jgi:hypothetical protein
MDTGTHAQEDPLAATAVISRDARGL